VFANQPAAHVAARRHPPHYNLRLKITVEHRRIDAIGTGLEETVQITRTEGASGAGFWMHAYAVTGKQGARQQLQSIQRSAAVVKKSARLMMMMII
jgi:hypothetical protein